MVSENLKNFIKALKKKDENTAKEILNHSDFNVTEKIADLSYLAITVLTNASIEIAKLLQEKGADVMEVNDQGWTLLHTSVAAGNNEFAKYVISQGVDPAAQDNEGNTFLHVSGLLNNIIPIAMKFGDKREEIYNSRIDELFAAKHHLRGNAGSTIKKLLEENDFKKLLEIKNKEGLTPALSAVSVGTKELLEVFKEAELDVRDAAGNNLLLTAAGNRNVEAVEYLLDNADKSNSNEFLRFVNSENKSGQNALAMALWSDGVVAKEEDRLMTKNFQVISDIISKLPKEQMHEEYCKLASTTILGMQPKNGIENINKLANALLDNGLNPNNRAMQFSILEKAAAIGNNELVLKMIGKGAEVDIPSKCGSNPLTSAINWNQPEAAKILLTYGARTGYVVNEKNGDNIFHQVVQLDNKEMVKAFIDSGKVDLEDKNGQGLTPLAKAIIATLLENVKLLINANVDIRNPVDKAGNTPIHYAAAVDFDKGIEILTAEDKKRKNLELQETHIEAEISNNQANGQAVLPITELRNMNQHTALHLAVFNNKKDAVITLLSNGAFPYATYENGLTILHACAVQNDPNMAKLILLNVKNMPIDITDLSGNTALHTTALHGSKEMAEFLKSKGARIDVVNKEGSSIAHLAAMKGHLNMIEFALENKVNIDAVNSGGTTPLTFAAVGGHLEVAKALIANKADVNAKDAGGDTPLMVTIQSGRHMIADMNARNASKEQLESQHFNAVKFLIDSGADLKVTMSGGENLLHVAAMTENVPEALPIIKLLIDSGVDCRAETKEGYTPHRVAAGNGNLEIYDYLKDHCKIEVVGDINVINQEG